MQRYNIFSIYTSPPKLLLCLRAFTQLFYIIIWKNNPSSAPITINLMGITKKENDSRFRKSFSPPMKKNKNRLFTNLLRSRFRHRNHLLQEQISLRQVAHKRNLPNPPNPIREYPHPNSNHHTAHCPRSTHFQ